MWAGGNYGRVEDRELVVQDHIEEAAVDGQQTSLNLSRSIVNSLWLSCGLDWSQFEHYSGVSMSEDVQPRLVKSTSLMRRVRTYVALLLVGCLLAGVPMWLESRECSRRLSEAEHQLKIATIENTLASAVMYARRGEYERARQASSNVLTSLAAETERGNESGLTQAQRDGLRALLGRRDEIITLLARNDPVSTDRLTDLYVSYRRIMNR